MQQCLRWWRICRQKVKPLHDACVLKTRNRCTLLFVCPQSEMATAEVIVVMATAEVVVVMGTAEMVVMMATAEVLLVGHVVMVAAAEVAAHEVGVAAVAVVVLVAAAAAPKLATAFYLQREPLWLHDAVDATALHHGQRVRDLILVGMQGESEGGARVVGGQRLCAGL